MIIRRLLYTFSILLITLGFSGVGQAAQPDTEAPIIVRVGHRLVAVSPSTGEVRVLDEVTPELDALFTKNYSGNGIRLDSISPDNVYAAYTIGVQDVLKVDDVEQQKAIAKRAPNDVYLVNIATGERTAVTHQADTFAEAAAEGLVENYDDLTWSLDGSRLYYVTQGRPLNNRPATRTLNYYDVAAGTTHEVVDLLRPPLTTDNYLVGVYPVPQGIAVLHAFGNNGQFHFLVFGEDNRRINQFEMELMGSQDVNAWMFKYNPIHMMDNSMFGYYTFDSTGPLPNVLDMPTNRGDAVNPSQHVTIVSHAAPSSSLRIVLDSLFVGDVPWVVADRAGNHLLTLETVVYDMDTAIAPDGQAVAYLDERGKTGEPRDILIYDGSEARSLGFAANEILWGAVEYSFTDLIHRG